VNDSKGQESGKLKIEGKKATLENFQISLILQGIGLTSFGFFTKIKPILVISKPVLSEE